MVLRNHTQTYLNHTMPFATHPIFVSANEEYGTGAAQSTNTINGAVNTCGMAVRLCSPLAGRTLFR